LKRHVFSHAGYLTADVAASYGFVNYADEGEHRELRKLYGTVWKDFSKEQQADAPPTSSKSTLEMVPVCSKVTTSINL